MSCPEELTLFFQNCTLSQIDDLAAWVSRGVVGLTFYADPQHKWDGTSLGDEREREKVTLAAPRAS
jgi:hypothetical protein